MSVVADIFQLAQEGNHLTYSRLPTNRNFVHGGPTGRAAQVQRALGKRKDSIMATPDKSQPKKHFFKVSTNFQKRSQEEQDAFYDLVVDTLLEQANNDDLSDEKKKPHGE
jgi:hypothetical protein